MPEGAIWSKGSLSIRGLCWPEIVLPARGSFRWQRPPVGWMEPCQLESYMTSRGFFFRKKAFLSDRKTSIGSGRDGTGRDGTGRDGTGRDGTGRDGTGRNGSERNGTRRDGTGREGRDGAGRDGTGREGTERNGENPWRGHLKGVCSVRRLDTR